MSSSSSKGSSGGGGHGSGDGSKPAALVSFIVFSRPLGSDDEAASLEEIVEKVLFFHPATASTNEQLARISICEGLIDFTSKFSPKDPVSVVHMRDHHYTFLQCEPGTWMVMIVRRAIEAPPATAGEGAGGAAGAKKVMGGVGAAGDGSASRAVVYASEGELDDTSLQAAASPSAKCRPI